MTMTMTPAPSRHTVSPAATVVAELSAIFQRNRTAAAAYGLDFVELWSLASESVLGGKLVRPMLVISTFDALKSDESEANEACHSRQTVISIAAAIELLHYSFLLHDDVIDGDLIRRGCPNLIGKILAKSDEREPTSTMLHWARTGGILMGDLLLASTHQTFARADLTQQTRLRMLDLLEHTITESVAGELIDVGLGDGIISPDLTTILNMCAYKTATYSFELPLRAAAILAGANSHVENALSTAGRHLGLAFQLQDDLLSTFGDPALHGKDAFSDLREGKLTALVAYARMTSAWPQIQQAFGRRDLTHVEGQHLQNLLRECGAEKFAQGLVDEQLRSFYEVLGHPSTPVPQAAARVLLDLVDLLEGRKS